MRRRQCGGEWGAVLHGMARAYGEGAIGTCGGGSAGACGGGTPKMAAQWPMGSQRG